MKVFDAHFHIIDDRFPITPNNAFVPDEFTIKDYQEATDIYNIEGGAIVSGSFQAFDQTYLIDSLNRLKKEVVGVANIPFGTSDEYLQTLHQSGVRAVRFNLKRGGSETVEHLQKLSHWVNNQYGWHTELYIDSNEMAGLKNVLKTIPRFSIDHLGLSKTGLKELYYWVEKGAKVKATGFGRIDFDPIPVMKTIHSIDPYALMFGTDLPSTRAQTPFSRADTDLIKDNFEIDDQRLIFYQNAFDWYIKSHKQIPAS